MIEEEDQLEEELPVDPDWDALGWKVPAGVWTFQVQSVGVARTRAGDDSYLRMILVPEACLETDNPEELAAFGINGRGATVLYSIFRRSPVTLDDFKRVARVSDSVYLPGKRLTARFHRNSSGFTELSDLRPYRRRA